MSTSTTTHQKRTYVTRACDHCRQRRAVCDNQKPKCSRCQKKRIECTFLVPQRKRGPIAKPKDSGLDPNQGHEVLVDQSYKRKISIHNHENDNNNNNVNIHSNGSNNRSTGSNDNNPNIIPLNNVPKIITMSSNNNNNNNNNNATTNSNAPIIETDTNFILDINQATDTEEKGEEDESSIFHQFIRSPSETPRPKAADPMGSYYPVLGDPVDLPHCHYNHHLNHHHNHHQPSVHDDIFSKPVVDHLVALFFERCFQDFDFFSPLNFLRLYVQGTVNQCLLDMICAVGSRFSDHPAVIKNPPYMSGEPYVERVKAKMGELISNASMDALHTLILMSFYEYSTARHNFGYRIECLSVVMASDLQLAQCYRRAAAVPPFFMTSSASSRSFSLPTEMLHESEANRVATEIKIRTWTFLLISDLHSSSVSGFMPKIDHSIVHPANPSTDINWWMERSQEPGGIPIEPVDEFSAAILYKILLPRPTLGAIDGGHTIMFLDIVTSICTFVKTEYTLEMWKNYMDAEDKVDENNAAGCNRAKPNSCFSSSGLAPGSSSSYSSSPPTSSSSAVSPGPLNAADSVNAATGTTESSPQWRRDQSEYTKLDSEVERWKTQLSPEFNPSHVKLSLFKCDKDVLHVGSCYYAMAILLHMPSLIPGVFLSDTSFFEDSSNSGIGGYKAEGSNPRSRGRGASAAATAESRQQGKSSRGGGGGEAKRGASVGVVGERGGTLE
ncbi:hypothetical protein BGZ95_001605, partial [Linnemannia exigua]